ncbi:hypothetical protein L2E82_35317 [Cichorium intybus]|uniref:Uncharacterized protein n=1 Tax=Cichorium intybus TaxID=13427 RepID=A0ACB9BNK0_CICIN|nr:hypothetical protein L2E82_35317 [Cichorium intybus]
MVVFGGIVCEREKGSGKEEEEYDIHIMCVQKIKVAISFTLVDVGITQKNSRLLSNLASWKRFEGRLEATKS